MLTTGCKSDADKCVDAVMTAYDNQYPQATKQERDSSKAVAHMNCQKG